MNGEGKQVRYLVGIALILCAVIIGYNLFFVKEPSPVIVVTDASELPGEQSALPAKINLNTVTAQELEDSLPGVGPVLAKRIVEYRQKNGSFEKLEDLKNVAGIGEKTFQKLKDFLTI